MITPNVIVTKRFDTMKRIFFGPKSMRDASFNSLNAVLESNALDDADSLICSPGNNLNLLEADLNIPPTGQSKGYLNLKFVENQAILEYFLLDFGPLETHFNRIYSLYSKAEIPLPEITSKLNKFYIAFGTGDNLNEWAGPFEVSLGAARIELNNNVKSIDLGFIMGNLESINSYNERLHRVLGFGLSDKLNPALPKDTIVRTKVDVPLNQGLGSKKGPRITKRDADRKRCRVPAFSWNPYIRELLRRYLGKVFGDPDSVMIVLGEDMDELLNSHLQNSESTDFCRNYQGKLKEFGINLKLPSPNPSYKSTPTTSKGAKKGGQEEIKLGGQNVKLDGSFNMSQDEQSHISWGDKYKAYKEYEEYHKRQGLTQANAENPPEYLELWDKNYLLTKCFIDMESIIDVDPSVKTPPDMLDPIFSFIGALRKYQSKPTEYALFELNDVEINDLINESVGGPYHTTSTNRLIFGDMALIKRLIYVSDEGKIKLSDTTAYKFTFSDKYLDDIDWDKYQEDFKKTIISRERSQTSSFKEKLDFGPFTSLFKEIKDQKDMIFLHGVKNSNVQSVSFQKDFAQAELMKVAVNAKKRSPFMNNFVKLAVTNDDFKIAALVRYLEGRKIFTDDINTSKFNLIRWIEDAQKRGSRTYKQLKILSGRSNSRTISQGLESKDEKFNDYVDLILGYRNILNSFEQTGFNIEVPYLSDANTDNNRILETYADLLEKMQRLIVKIQIKTLPFFNQKAYFNKDCYFFSVYNNILSSSRNRQDKVPSTFLNGSYHILGARHFMSYDDAFSEFVLSKPGGPGSDDPVLDQTRKVLSQNVPSKDSSSSKDPKITSDGEATRLPNVNKRQAVAQKIQSGSTDPK